MKLIYISVIMLEKVLVAISFIYQKLISSSKLFQGISLFAKTKMYQEHNWLHSYKAQIMLYLGN